jgi:hypothetical protein
MSEERDVRRTEVKKEKKIKIILKRSEERDVRRPEVRGRECV